MRRLSFLLGPVPVVNRVRTKRERPLSIRPQHNSNARAGRLRARVQPRQRTTRRRRPGALLDGLLLLLLLLVAPRGLALLRVQLRRVPKELALDLALAVHRPPAARRLGGLACLGDRALHLPWHLRGDVPGAGCVCCCRASAEDGWGLL